MNAKIIRPKTFDDWLNINKASIGGSKIATILGLSYRDMPDGTRHYYDTPFQLWQRMTGRAAPPEENRFMINGRYLENAVAEMFEYYSGHRIIKASKEQIVYQHPVHTFINGTPDRRAVLLPSKEKAVWEGKTTMNIFMPEEIPFSWYTQPQFYMGLMGYQKAIICWFELRINEIKWRELDFNPEIYNGLIDVAVEFYEKYIVKDIPPPSMTGDDVKAKFPRSMPRYLDATERLVAIYQRIKEIDDQAKPLNAERSSLVEEVKVSIGAYEGIKYMDTPLFTFKTIKDGTRRFRVVE